MVSVSVSQSIMSCADEDELCVIPCLLPISLSKLHTVLRRWIITGSCLMYIVWMRLNSVLSCTTSQDKQPLSFFFWRPKGWHVLTSSNQRKIGKQPLESARNCFDVHYRECLSLYRRTICFKIQINVCCSAMQMWVSSQNHSYPFVYLQCWVQLCDFSVFWFWLWFCLHLGVYLSQMWLGLHRGGYRRLQVSFSMAVLPHSLSLMACCNSWTARLPWRLFQGLLVYVNNSIVSPDS